MNPRDYGDWTYIRHIGSIITWEALWFSGHLTKEALEEKNVQLGAMRWIHFRDGAYLRTGWGQSEGIKVSTGVDFEPN